MSFLLQLILGGSRSGKSARAEEIARQSYLPVTYIATYSAEAIDLEMQARIARHRQRRPETWQTVENRFDLKNLIEQQGDRLLLLDCLTLWLSYQQMTHAEGEILSDLEAVLHSAKTQKRPMIIVSGELGTGLVPETAQARIYRDLVGTANQRVAECADRVELIVAGLPLVLKGAK